MTSTTIIILLFIGLFSGILSGMIGVGGGIIIVPALVFFLGFSQAQAQGTSLGLLLLPLGILAVYNYYQKGMIDIRDILVMGITFIVGAWLGSKIALALNQQTLKKIFAIFLFYISFRMLQWDVIIFKWIKNIFTKSCC